MNLDTVLDVVVLVLLVYGFHRLGVFGGAGRRRSRDGD